MAKAEGSRFSFSRFFSSLHRDEGSRCRNFEDEVARVMSLKALALDSDTLKGDQMKSHVVLLGRMLEDLSIQCCTSTELDFKTIKLRVEEEGLSFLTITLPTFGRDLERALDQGSVDPFCFLGFRKKKALPAFLQGLTGQIFNEDDGVLLDEPSIDAIRGIRQVCYLFKKLRHPCSDARVSAAFSQFVETDNQVFKHSLTTIRHSFYDDYRRVSALLFGTVFSNVDRKIFNGDVTPKHGPGATADKVRGNAKYDNRVWTERLEGVFAASEFLFPSVSHYLDGVEDVTWLVPEEEIPVRVVSVPKTLKTPRIIAIEPTYQQYVQQALMECVVDEIEKDYYLRDLIGFRDQEMNKTMACHGSSNLDLATLDLSEASDRVSLQHVEQLLWNHTWFFRGVSACRSSLADVPGFGVHRLAKFASMGSALTFPMEAMVFTTLIFLGIERENRAPISEETIKSLIGKVRVYGDDIIVPVEYVQSVISTLQDFGLVVNERKSFWTGKFRESCGGDFYDGIQVNPVYCTRDLPRSRRHVPEIHSAVALRNQLNEVGYWRTVEYLDHLIGGIIPFPKVLETSQALGRVSHTLDFDVDRVCPHLQRPLVKAAIADDCLPDSPISGTGALMKWFLKRGDDPLQKGHLERAGRPVAVNIKLRYVSPY